MFASKRDMRILTEDYYRKFMNSNCIDYTDNYCDDTQKKYASAMCEFINSLISSSPINEEFTSSHNADLHFKAHCSGGDSSDHKWADNVRYDFKTIDEYLAYEQEVSNLIKSAMNSDDTNIANLTEPNEVEKLRHNTASLLKYHDDICYVFDIGCGFTSQNTNSARKGYPCIVALHKTTAPVLGNEECVDFVVLTSNMNTITLYPIKGRTIVKLMQQFFDSAGVDLNLWGYPKQSEEERQKKRDDLYKLVNDKVSGTANYLIDKEWNSDEDFAEEIEQFLSDVCEDILEHNSDSTNVFTKMEYDFCRKNMVKLVKSKLLSLLKKEL